MQQSKIKAKCIKSENALSKKFRKLRNITSNTSLNKQYGVEIKVNKEQCMSKFELYLLASFCSPVR